MLTLWNVVLIKQKTWTVRNTSISEIFKFFSGLLKCSSSHHAGSCLVPWVFVIICRLLQLRKSVDKKYKRGVLNT